MLRQKSQRKFFEIVVVFILSFSFLQDQVIAQDFNRISRVISACLVLLTYQLQNDFLMANWS